MTISDSTLATDVWSDVRGILVGSLTIDSSSVSVSAAFSDKKVSKPQVIIYPINVAESKFKFGGKYGQRFVDVIVESYATSTADLDSLTDQIKGVIRDALYDETLTGIDLVGTQEDYTSGVYNKQKLHIKTITFAFDRE